MRGLDKMVGRWEGKGWFMQRDGSRMNFTGSEIVQSKLQGRALLVEGLFHAEAKPDEVVHQTLAVVTYDPNQKTHLMRANLFNMPYGEHKLTVTLEGFTWSLGGPNAPPIIYTAALKGDEWVEVGEISMEGRPKMQFFEMRLKRVPTTAK